MKKVNFKNQDGLEFLQCLPDNSVDLILTDPPYITSRDSGMDRWVKHVEAQDEDDAKNIKTEQDWNNHKTLWQWFEWFYKGGVTDFKKAQRRLTKMKESYLKYGSIYGKKYAVTTNYGEWDSEFTVEKLGLFVEQFYRVLRNGGSAIIWFDVWKIESLKNMLESNKFKQARMISWIKTNPQPINSSRNYLSNCREIALTVVKKGTPTFNSKYDNGVYMHPTQGGKDRFHPTQKSLPLFEELVLKHSNEGDVVVDPFAGSATTAIAALKHKRHFYGCELDKSYYIKSKKRIERLMNE
tara:strand:+ start:2149 stop:3036 length:888 start_codon:yes stop_codon:yes gene_type:complete